jgi:hypothetical protein
VGVPIPASDEILIIGSQSQTGIMLLKVFAMGKTAVGHLSRR